MIHTSYQLTLNGKIILLFISSFLLLVGCNYRIELYNDKKELQEEIFDNLPPNISIIHPIDGSVLSNVSLILGQTEDKSPTITYILLGNNTFYFTNQRNWVLEINTIDFTNGKLEIEVFAKDSLNNISQKKKFTFYISNTIDLYMLPERFFITNNTFEFYLTLNTTNYSKLEIYLNSSLILETNGTKNLRLSIQTNQEYFTNILTCVLENITNTRFFVFDYTPPIVEIQTPPYSYIYENFPLKVLVNDFYESLLFLSNGNILNTFQLENTTNQIFINTHHFTNGTNIITFWAKDKAGNVSSYIDIPTIVANFSSTEYNRTKNKNYYQLDIELFEEDTILFYTDNNFGYIFIARENDNFKPRRTTSSSINVSPLGKIRSIKMGEKILLCYKRDDESLIIRTNRDSGLTNFLQMFNHNPVLDFEIFNNNNKLYLIKTTLDGKLIATDISNRPTNFITNFSRDFNIFSEKYQTYNMPIFGIYNEQEVILFTNFGILFYTNQYTIGGSIVSLSLNEFHFCIYGSNTAIIYLVYNNSILTNYIISSTNRIYYIVGSRYNDNNSSIWGLVEEVNSGELSLKLIQVNKNKIIREQFISKIKYSEIYGGFRESVIWSKNDFTKIIIISTEAESGSYYGKIVKFTGL